jgi:hypothetical protein
MEMETLGTQAIVKGIRALRFLTLLMKRNSLWSLFLRVVAVLN